MTPAPTVSILLTTYNFARYAGVAVESLLRQREAPDFELLITDDASTDGTADLLRRHADDPRISLTVNPVNLGCAATLTALFARARGRYLARLDGDDHWHPDFLARTVAALEADHELGFVYTDVAHIDSDGRVTRASGGLSRPAGLPLRGHELVPILTRNYVCAPGLVARREAFALAKPWNARFAMGPGDWYATLSMAARYPSLHIPEPLAFYRIHDLGMHRQMSRSRAGEEVVEWILDQFLDRPEASLSRGAQRRLRARHRIEMATAAIAQGRHDDAKRLARSAYALDPALLIRPRLVRLGLAVELGPQLYQQLKRWIGA